ncbi:hypothetical protein V3C99_002745 [Haemonchus contortus]
MMIRSRNWTKASKLAVNDNDVSLRHWKTASAAQAVTMMTKECSMVVVGCAEAKSACTYWKYAMKITTRALPKRLKEYQWRKGTVNEGGFFRPIQANAEPEY